MRCIPNEMRCIPNEMGKTLHMDTNDVPTCTDQESLIVSEILCYIQNEMSTGDHDFLKKTVCKFYSAK